MDVAFLKLIRRDRFEQYAIYIYVYVVWIVNIAKNPELKFLKILGKIAV